MAARLEHAAVDRARQRLGGLARLDQHGLPGADGEGVLDDHARVEVVERIHQTSSLPSLSSGSPSASMRPPRRRSQIRSQWIADAFSPPSMRERAAQREVARAADLLVEEGGADRALHHLVRADRELAEAPRALVGVEAREQLVLAERGGGVDDDAAPRSAAARRGMSGRSAATARRTAISPSTPPRGGQQKTSPSGRFASPAHDSHGTALDVHRQVRAGRHDAQLAHAREPVDQPLVALARAHARRPPGRARRAAARSRRTAPRRACPCARSARPARSGYAAPTHRSSPAASRSSWRRSHGARARASAASRCARDAGALGRVARGPDEEPAVELLRRSRARRDRGRRPARRCRRAGGRRAPTRAPSRRSRARRAATPRAPSRAPAARPPAASR